MYIIADVEWVQNELNICSPTQLSAARVDENWEIVEYFSTLIRPMNSSFHDWNHIAYTGGRPKQFMDAPHCYDAFTRFNQWVGEHTLCWWYRQSAYIHATMNRTLLNVDEPKQPIVLCEYIPGFLAGDGKVGGGPYKIAKAKEIPVYFMEHNSWDDVMTILSLFRGINFPQSALSLPPDLAFANSNLVALARNYQYDGKRVHNRGCPLLDTDADLLGFETLKDSLKKKYKPCSCVKEEMILARRERLLKEIENSQYNFVHTETSDVFHRYDCPLILNKAYHVLGAVKYDTVYAKGLRPCRICNPSPDDTPRQPIVADAPKRTPKKKEPPKPCLTRAEIAAVTRLEQAQKERSGIANFNNMSKEEIADSLTLTNPGLVFFVGRGFLNFHLRHCPRLDGVKGIRGFNTFDRAVRAGFTPCKYCKPTKKKDVVASIPISSKTRENETIMDLRSLCDDYGYGHGFRDGCFEVATPAGRWKIHADAHPVTVEHINLTRSPDTETYHKQHRIFLSMTDALQYIHRHDSKLAVDSDSTDGDLKDSVDSIE